jgi:hypothetical protein
MRHRNSQSSDDRSTIRRIHPFSQGEDVLIAGA